MDIQGREEQRRKTPATLPVYLSQHTAAEGITDQACRLDRQILTGKKKKENLRRNEEGREVLTITPYFRKTQWLELVPPSRNTNVYGSAITVAHLVSQQQQNHAACVVTVFAATVLDQIMPATKRNVDVKDSTISLPRVVGCYVADVREKPLNTSQ